MGNVFKDVSVTKVLSKIIKATVFYLKIAHHGTQLEQLLLHDPNHFQKNAPNPIKSFILAVVHANLRAKIRNPLCAHFNAYLVAFVKRVLSKMIKEIALIKPIALALINETNDPKANNGQTIVAF